MAAAMSSLTKSLSSCLGKRSSSHSSTSLLMQLRSSVYYSSKASSPSPKVKKVVADEIEEENTSLTSGISMPLADILKQLNKKVPDSLIRQRTESGFTIRYVPWHIVNRIMNLHAPEWSGEVRSITYSGDGKSVSVVYRVTIYGIDAEIYRESTGTASMEEIGYGDPVQKAEAMAFRRACARFGLGLHLYHEDTL